MQDLKQYILSKIDISSEDLEKILKAFTYKKFKKEQTIIRNGQHVTKYYFIAKGGVRFVIDTPEKEVTAWFIFENNFFSDLESIRLGQVSKSKIIALDETEIYSIETKAMLQFYEAFPEWQKFGRIIMEDAFLNVIDSLISFQTMDSETRYLKMIQKSDIINRVPLKHLASYLGITPNSLSRIRKNIR
ncbi:Crp/Fnr family transcriptional regulator [Flavobacterium sp. J27]|uniref:Crp/Fnr family transcriptional regulator n=1 Tax=Flavobacterium sp. J27 TaxID=2060419 RepID=UPI001031D352|nr:Crp/Fnr family transcriptional regulator [Flavobacterium sp. J27]